METYDGETVGINVRRLRLAADPPLRQVDLSKRTGLGQTVISSIETLTRSRVSENEVQTLARGLGLESTDPLLQEHNDSRHDRADRLRAKGSGASLRARRIALGMSQSKAANRIGTTQFQVSMAERGNPATVRAVGDAYDRALQEAEAAL